MICDARPSGSGSGEFGLIVDCGGHDGMGGEFQGVKMSDVIVVVVL